MGTPRTDLEVIQGADFALTFNVKGSDGNLVDFTGWSGRLQCRDLSDNGGGTPLFELSSDAGGTVLVAGVPIAGGGGITIAGTSVTVSMLGPPVTQQLDFDLGHYDLYLTSPGGTHAQRDFWGAVCLAKGVTHHV